MKRILESILLMEIQLIVMVSIIAHFQSLDLLIAQSIRSVVRILGPLAIMLVLLINQMRISTSAQYTLDTKNFM